MPTEHNQTSTRTRLLWTLGLAAAAAGITLALDSQPANAHDTRPTTTGDTRLETPILDSVGQLVDHTLRNVAELPAATLTPTEAGKPRPVRNLVTHTTKTVDTAVNNVTSTVRAVTDTADKATKPLPVLGGTVDTVTDITDHITEQLPTLTPPATVDAAPTPTRPAQPAAGDGSDDTSSGGTTPNPALTSGGSGSGGSEGGGGDAPGAAPVPHGQAAAPGAHHPTIGDTADTRHGATQNRGNDVNLTATPTSPPQPASPTDPSDCASTTGTLTITPSGEPQPSTPAHLAHHPPTHRTHTTAHTGSAAHRTTEPPSPSG
ncbi:hypothetical protein [Micromonospora tulbaghiae]|uniref:hypothetical protein n=1 Tax=Micromonospora tulbaghiae TaxID=479978 RepID=UPI0033DC7B39